MTCSVFVSILQTLIYKGIFFLNVYNVFKKAIISQKLLICSEILKSE